MTETDSRSLLAAIPAKFATPDPNDISKMPKGGTMLDYMGHASVTLALIEVDPTWSWEPAAIDPETGGPVITTVGNRLVMWAWLTVLGVRRLAVGTCEARKGEPEKELIGDLLRNGAMRFGIGTRLWSKAERDEQPVEQRTTAQKVRDVAKPAAKVADESRQAAASQVKQIADILGQLGLSREQMLEYCEAAVERPLAKASELSHDEATKILKILTDGGAQ